MRLLVRIAAALALCAAQHAWAQALMGGHIMAQSDASGWGRHVDAGALRLKAERATIERVGLLAK
jgi:hypothetical protein